MDNNEGNLDLFKQLTGKGDRQAPQQQRATPEQRPAKQVFPWGDDWLSVHNDILFEEI